MTEEKESTVVLIVEDDREMRSLLCDELYDLGLTKKEEGRTEGGTKDDRGEGVYGGAHR